LWPNRPGDVDDADERVLDAAFPGARRRRARAALREISLGRHQRRATVSWVCGNNNGWCLLRRTATRQVDAMASILERLRQKIRDRAYYLSSHAEEEMEDDHLERQDIEHAILTGRIQKKLTKDPRGPRFRVEGPTGDGRLIHVICRLDENENLRIITVYA